MSRLWPYERTKRLYELWGADVDLPAIARELGVTLNSVIGKCHRLGLRGCGTKALVHRPDSPSRYYGEPRKDPRRNRVRNRRAALP